MSRHVTETLLYLCGGKTLLDVGRQHCFNSLYMGGKTAGYFSVEIFTFYQQPLCLPTCCEVKLFFVFCFFVHLLVFIMGVGDY